MGILKRLFPRDDDRDAAERREIHTREVIKESKEAQRDSYIAVAEAYKLAGVQLERVRK